MTNLLFLPTALALPMYIGRVHPVHMSLRTIFAAASGETCLNGLAGPEYHAIISFGLPIEPEDSQYGKSRMKMAPRPQYGVRPVDTVSPPHAAPVSLMFDSLIVQHGRQQDVKQPHLGGEVEQGDEVSRVRLCPSLPPPHTARAHAETAGKPPPRQPRSLP